MSSEFEKVLKSDQKVQLNPRVEDIMSRNVVGIKPTDNLKHVLEVMLKDGYKRLPVVDNNMELLGVITDKDIRVYAKSYLDHDLKDILDSLESYKVSDILPDKSLCKKSHQGERITQCAKEMLHLHMNGLPVVDSNEKLIGVITRSDMLDQLIRILDPIDSFSKKEKKD